jgi:hypothetical protein
MGVIQFSVGTATTDSATSLPAGAYVYDANVEIVTPYPEGTTIEVGQSIGAPDTFQQTSDNDPSTIALDGYSLAQTTQSAGGAPIRATVGGAPGSGEAIVTIQWAQPQP